MTSQAVMVQSLARRKYFSERRPTLQTLLTKGELTKPYQNIDATLSAADITAIKDALTNITQKLPFLVSLTNSERKSLFKTSASRLSLCGWGGESA